MDNIIQDCVVKLDQVVESKIGVQASTSESGDNQLPEIPRLSGNASVEDGTQHILDSVITFCWMRCVFNMTTRTITLWRQTRY